MKMLIKTLLIAIALIVGGQMGFGYLMKWEYEAQKSSFANFEKGTWKGSSAKEEKEMGKLIEKFLEVSEGMDEPGLGKKCEQKRDPNGIPIWSKMKESCY